MIPIPERTVKVNLVAQVNGYISGMETAARKTRDLGSEAEKLAAKRQAFEDLGRPLLAFGAIAAAAVAVAIKKFADFDAAMSNVGAVTQATTDDMELLRDAALDAGGRTAFTATEAANALEELGKASFETKTSIDALEGTLALAASGQLEVARAAEITATTLKQYNLEGSKAGHVADVLSAGAGKALGSVEDLSEGLKYVGPVAASMNVSLEESVGALALFADQGLIGEQAGTSLRGVLSSLTSPSQEAAKTIKELGIELYDSNGQFLGLENVAGQLSGAFTDLDDRSRDAALGVIFGNQQVTAARVLFAGGAEAINKYSTEVNDAGYAARVAADRMDNLSGDVEKLGGAFDTALIKTGSGANDTLRQLVQSLTFMVDGVSEVPEPVLNAGLAVGAIAAAMALAGGASLVAVPRIAAFRAAMVNTQIGARGAATAVAGIGGAIGIATVAIGFFVAKQAQAAATTSELQDSLDKASGATTDYTRDLIAKKLAESGAFDSAKNLGISQKELTDAVLEGGDALDEINKKLGAQNNIVDFFNGSGIAASFAKDSIKELTEGLADSKKNFEDQAAATEVSSSTVDEFSGKVQFANVDLKDLKATIEGFGAAQLDVNSATRSFEAAIDDVTAAVAENGQTLDVTTEAGRSNSAAIDDIATSTLGLASAILEQTGSQDQAAAAVARGRDELIKARVAAGDSQEAAEAYADALGLIPANVATVFEMTGLDAAAQKLSAIYKSLSSIKTGAKTGNFSISGGVGGQVAYASGGYTPSTATFAMVGEEGTEFVSKASTVADPANRAVLEYMHAGGSMSAAPAYRAAPSSGGSSPIAVQVVNKSGAAVSDLIDLRIQQHGLWQSVDLDGGTA